MPPSGYLLHAGGVSCPVRICHAQLVSAGGLCRNEGRKTDASIRSPPAGTAEACPVHPVAMRMGVRIIILQERMQGNRHREIVLVFIGCTQDRYDIPAQKNYCKNSQFSEVKLEFGLFEGLFYDILKKSGSPVRIQTFFRVIPVGQGQQR